MNQDTELQPVRVSENLTPSIRRIKAADFEAATNVSELIDEYAAECAIDGMPPPRARLVLYRQLESSGAICALAGFDGEQLAGFVVVISTELPHYGRLVSTLESFFVGKAWRRTGLGLALLKRAEQVAREVGSPGLLVSAPAGGVLERVLPRVGYSHTNTVFFKRLADE